MRYRVAVVVGGMASKTVVRRWDVVVSLAAVIAAAGVGCGKSGQPRPGTGGRPGSGADGGAAGNAQGGLGAAGSSASSGGADAGGESASGGSSGAAGKAGATGGRGGTAGGQSGGWAGVPSTGGLDSGSGGRAGDGAGGSPDEMCEAPPSSPCFEPCGGDPSGTWLLEDTCFDGATVGDECPGGFLTGRSVSTQMRMRIIQSRQIEVESSDSWEMRGTLPYECLGIDSASSCDAATYVSLPLLTSFVTGLACQENECGSCDCAGTPSAGTLNPTALELGDMTLKFASKEVPYCVQDDVMMIGGRGTDGKPMASYKFRKRSCTGPTCSELTDEQCINSYCDLGTSGCEGTYPPCNYYDCEESRGCSWGPARPRCSLEFGEPSTGCETLSVEQCDSAPGCIIDW